MTQPVTRDSKTVTPIRPVSVVIRCTPSGSRTTLMLLQRPTPVLSFTSTNSKNLSVTVLHGKMYRSTTAICDLQETSVVSSACTATNDVSSTCLAISSLYTSYMQSNSSFCMVLAVSHLFFANHSTLKVRVFLPAVWLMPIYLGWWGPRRFTSNFSSRLRVSKLCSKRWSTSFMLSIRLRLCASAMFVSNFSRGAREEDEVARVMTHHARRTMQPMNCEK